MKNNKTRNEFEKALFKLLEEKNYHDITINEICVLTNKTKMTFYHYFKDKEALLADGSINMINNEYNPEYYKILKRETDPEEVEYQSLLVTYDWVAKHYNQIQNLVYRGEVFPLEIFKRALFDNYSKGMSDLINAKGYIVPGDYLAIFFFEGLFETSLYYASQLKNNKKEAKEDIRRICRLLAKAVISMTKAAS